MICRPWAAAIVLASVVGGGCAQSELTGDPRQDVLNELDRIEGWLPDALRRLADHYGLEEINFSQALKERCIHLTHPQGSAGDSDELRALYPDLADRRQRCRRETLWAFGSGEHPAKRDATNQALRQLTLGRPRAEIEWLRRQVTGAGTLAVLVDLVERTEVLRTEYAPECIERFREVVSLAEPHCGPGVFVDADGEPTAGRSPWYDRWMERYGQ